MENSSSRIRSFRDEQMVIVFYCAESIVISFVSHISLRNERFCVFERFDVAFCFVLGFTKQRMMESRRSFFMLSSYSKLKKEECQGLFCSEISSGPFPRFSFFDCGYGKSRYVILSREERFVFAAIENGYCLSVG